MRLGRGSKNSPHNATKSRIRKTAVMEISDAFAPLLKQESASKLLGGAELITTAEFAEFY
jgi:hypothetical protein